MISTPVKKSFPTSSHRAERGALSLSAQGLLHLRARPPLPHGRVRHWPVPGRRGLQVLPHHALQRAAVRGGRRGRPLRRHRKAVRQRSLPGQPLPLSASGNPVLRAQQCWIVLHMSCAEPNWETVTLQLFTGSRALNFSLDVGPGLSLSPVSSRSLGMKHLTKRNGSWKSCNVPEIFSSIILVQ